MSVTLYCEACGRSKTTPPGCASTPCQCGSTAFTSVNPKLPAGISITEWPQPFRACPPRGLSQR